MAYHSLPQNWSDLTERSDKAEVELAVLRLFSVLMSRSHQSERPAGMSSAYLLYIIQYYWLAEVATVLLKYNIR